MKRLLKPLFITFVFVSLIMLAKVTFADTPAPDPPPGHGSSGDGQPMGAPIDGGLSILLAMGAAYGGKKLYQARKEKKEADELTS